jgi:hypothetical protein
MVSQVREKRAAHLKKILNETDIDTAETMALICR